MADSNARAEIEGTPAVREVAGDQQVHEKPGEGDVLPEMQTLPNELAGGTRSP